MQRKFHKKSQYLVCFVASLPSEPGSWSSQSNTASQLSRILHKFDQSNSCTEPPVRKRHDVHCIERNNSYVIYSIGGFPIHFQALQVPVPGFLRLVYNRGRRYSLFSLSNFLAVSFRRVRTSQSFAIAYRQIVCQVHDVETRFLFLNVVHTFQFSAFS